MADQRFHQSPCDPISTIDRVRKMVSAVPLDRRKVLCLGDDDFISIALAKFTDADVYTLDIDPKILEVVEKIKSKENLNIKLIQHDLKEQLPSDLVNSFDCISCDPPQSLNGEIFFLQRAYEALKNELSVRTYVSVTPYWMGLDDYHKLQYEILRMGFTEIEHYKCQMRFPALSRYYSYNRNNTHNKFISDLLKNTILMSCDLFVLKKLIVK